MNRDRSVSIPLFSSSFALFVLLATSIQAQAADIHWTNAAGGNWNTSGNWNSGSGPVPGASDNAIIDLAGTYTVTLDVNATVASLALGGASGVQTLSSTSHTITLNGASTIGANGVLLLTGSTVGGAGTLDNQGTLESRGATNINGPYTSSAASLLRANGINGSSTLTFANGFTNNGTIELTSTAIGYPATLNVTAGTLVNAATRNINVLAGAGGARTLGAQLDNQGTLTVDAPLALSKPSVDHLSSGTIDLTNANLTLTQSGTTPTFTMTAGTITIGVGHSLDASGGAFNYNGGSFAGSGTLDFSSVTWNLGTGFTNALTGLTMTSTTVNGPGTLTNASGQTLTLLNCTINAPLVNQETLVNRGSTGINGAYTSGTGSLLQADGVNGSSVLTFANGFTNNGTIDLTSTAIGYAATLNVTAGTLVNAATRSINVLAGAGGARTLGAQLDNQGTLTVDAPLTMNRASADHLNSGTIDLTNADLTLTQSGTTPTFTMTAGTITIGVGHSLDASNGVFNYNGGSITGSGTLTLFGLTWNLGIGFTNALTGLTMTSTTVNGPGTLTNASGQTLTLVNVTINAPLVNQGTLVSRGVTGINGAYTSGNGTMLQLNGINGTSVLTFANGFTNNGTIELTSTAIGYAATLNVTAGTLVNAATRNINVLAGAGGARTLGAQLDNQGTLTVNAPLTLSKPSGDHLNSGTIDLTNANLTLTQSGTTPAFTITAGTITIGAGHSLDATNGVVNYNGGSITGSGTLAFSSMTWNLGIDFTNALTGLTMTSTTVNGPGTLTNASGQTLALVGCTINADLVNQGTLVARGGTNVNGAFTSGTGTLLRADGNGGAAILTFANGFTNNGTIEMTSVGAGFTATLNVTNGTLVNDVGRDIDVLAGAGGGRTLAAQLDNRGTLTVGAPLTLSKGSADHLNSGTIDLTNQDLTLTQSGTTPSFTTTGTITIGVGHTLAVTNGVFSLNGGSIAGGGGLDLSTTTWNLGIGFSNALTSLTIANSTVNGPGTLTNATGKTQILPTCTINADLVNQGTLVARGGTNVNGAYTPGTGTLLRADGNGGAAILTFANGFTNNGTIEMTSAGAGFTSTLNVTNGTLVNDVGRDIDVLAGAGGGRTLGAELDNRGTLAVNAPLTLSKGSADHLNSGTIDLTNANLTLTQSGTTPTFTNTGTITIGSTRILSVNTGPFTNASGGTLQGAGTLDVAGATFSNAGNINPGTSPGILSITGACPLTPTSALNLEIAGTTAGTEYDRLAVSGAATLDGALNVGFIGGFTPILGNSFTVMTYGSRTGSTPFAPQLPALGAGLKWDVLYNPTSVVLNVASTANAPPVLGAIGDKTVNELALLSFTATATDADLPPQTLTFSLDAGAPTGASINGATGAFTWTPTEAQGPGSFPITVRVTDNGAPPATNSETITVTVNEVNVAPVVANPGNRTTNELALLSYTVTATDADLPANTRTFALGAGAPPGAAITAGGAFTWTPTEAQGPGTYPVTYTATDNGTPPLAGSVSNTITVNEVNVAPVVTAPANQTVNELVLLSYTVTATDADLPANTLTFTLGAGAPSGAAITAGGAFTWTPSEAQGPGVYPITYTATDNGTPPLAGSASNTITVNEVNVAPVVTAPANQTVNELVLLSYTVTATDADIPANTLTFTLGAGAPSGAAITAGGAFTWTPSEAQGPGVYPITYTATDNGTPPLAGSASNTITVNEVNVAPVVTAPANQTVNELVLLSYTVTATDADLPANTLTFTLGAGAPSGAAITAGGAFTWTPSEAQGPGTYPITYTATDNGTPPLAGSASNTITVNEVNVAPVVTAPANQTVNEGVLVSYTVTATDADLPANTLTFTLGAGAPSGAAITAGGAFTWTPSEAQGPGTYPVTYTATDNGTPPLAGSASNTITVNEVNTAPVVTNPGPRSGAPGTLITYTVTATDTDLPAQTLTFTLGAGAPSGAAITAGGVFSWTPSAGQTGTFPVTYTATDNGTPPLAGSATNTITVTSTNLPPVVTNPGNRTTSELVLLSYTVAATDADLPAQTLTFTLGAGAPSGAAIAAGGAFTWTPTEAQGPGTYPVTYTATDNGTPPLAGSATNTITVNEVNTAPVVTAPANQTVNEGTLVSYTVTATDADLPANTLTFTLGAGAPTGAAITAGGAFTWTPTEAQGPGTYPVTYTATDNGTPPLAGSASNTITVNEVNTAPVVTNPGPKSGTTGNLISYTVVATDTDLSAQTLTFTLGAGAPSGAAITVGGAFTWTPSGAQTGAFPVTYTATDNGTPPLAGSATNTITVGLTNTAPTVTNPGNKTTNELVLLSYTVVATDPDAGQVLTFTLGAGAPSGAAITAGGAFTWTPTEAQGPGTYPVTYTATDNGSPPLPGSASNTITVNEVNVAPVVTAPANRTVNEGVLVSYTVTATDADLPANTLTFTLGAGAPAGAAITAGGAFTWTPTEAQGPGTYPVTYTATDNGSPPITGSASNTITVNEVNVAPVLAAIGNKTVDGGVLLSFTATASDADIPANTMTFSLDAGAPAGAAITAGGAFTWTPTATQQGNFPVTVRVTDNGTPVMSDFEAIMITVNPIPTASINNVTVTEGNSGTVDAVFTVTLSAASSQTVTVNFATADNTATTPDDYPLTGGTLTFSPGTTSRPVTITVYGDTVDEGIETFFVNLTNPTNATISDAQGICTISNDDAVVVAPVQKREAWRQHPELIGQYLPQTMGDLSVTKVEVATLLLKFGDGPDWNNKLRAEFLATLLNIASGAPNAACIAPTVTEVQNFLAAHGQMRLTMQNNHALADEAHDLMLECRAFNDGHAPCGTGTSAPGAAGAAAAAPENMFQLGANYPNPFHGGTEIEYSLTQAGLARLVVYDVRGREVKVLVDESQAPGDHSAGWDGTNASAVPVASGIYFYRLTVGQSTKLGRMIMAR